MKLVHGSLFSGFDAPSVAASWMGWENAFHCEINDFCNTILKYWFPNSEHYEDITKTDFSQWRGRIDILTGGFPCQPFSVAGQRKGADDNRYLWPHMLRAIQEIRPAWVIGENVAGILTMVQPGEETEMGSQTSLFGEDNGKRVLLRQEYVVETICKDLEREGYSVQPLLIPACAVGAPPTEETGCGLLPTVQTQGLKRCNEKGQTEFYPMELLPTPMATDIYHPKRFKEMKDAGGETFHSRKNGEIRPNGLMDFMDFHGMLPTPTARDYKSSISPNGMIRKNGKLRNDALSNIPVMLGEHCQQGDGKTSQLNPLPVCRGNDGLPSDVPYSRNVCRQHRFVPSVPSDKQRKMLHRGTIA